MRQFLRRNVVSLEPYAPEAQTAKVLVNANENPYNLPEEIRDEIAHKVASLNFNRYPDPLSMELREKFSKFSGQPVERILAGSGLDEVILMLTESFVGPNDTVVSHSPGFSMYQIWTQIADGEFIWVDDKEGYEIDVDGLIQAANDHAAKIVYVCRPNNPTGYTIPKEDVIRLLEETDSLIVLDEAYADFSEENLLELVEDYPRLVVLRTLSKAFSLPSARVGFAIASPEIISSVMKVKAPYNLNALTQAAAGVVLDHAGAVLSKVPEIVNEREKLMDFFKSYPALHPYPSQANFIYLTTKDAPELSLSFQENGVAAKYFKDKDAFRVSIGTPVENQVIMRAVRLLYDE